MRILVMLVALSLPGYAAATSRAVVLGPAARAELRDGLSRAVTMSCGFEVVPAECDDLRCAFETLMSARADYAIEATFPDEAVLLLTLSDQPSLRVLGRASVIATGTAEETLALAEVAVGNLCAQRYAAELAPAPADTPPLTHAAIEDRAFVSVTTMQGCFRKLSRAAAFADAKGTPVMEWVVRGDGSTAAVAMVEPALADKLTAACFEEEIAGWRFPPRARAELIRHFSLMNALQSPQPAKVQDLSPTESLSREDISDGVRAHEATLTPCVQSARQARVLETGRVPLVLAWTIRPDGTTTDVALTGAPAVQDGSLRQCIEKAVRAWRFRPSKKGAAVGTFPLSILVK